MNAIARDRGQTLAQMALAWTLRDRRVTSALVGASSADQLEENLKSLEKASFSADELAAIDRFAIDSNINIWTERAPAGG
jgi:L-glyceraldehyde 3-phosphate reductase